MDYSNLALFAFGLGGILCHNLMKLSQLNKEKAGNIVLTQYLNLEKYNIALSLCVVLLGILSKSEIKQLDKLGSLLGLTFVTLGYMAQSIIITYMGKAQKFLDNQNKD